MIQTSSAECREGSKMGISKPDSVYQYVYCLLFMCAKHWLSAGSCLMLAVTSVSEIPTRHYSSYISIITVRHDLLRVNALSLCVPLNAKLS